MNQECTEHAASCEILAAQQVFGDKPNLRVGILNSEEPPGPLAPGYKSTGGGPPNPSCQSPWEVSL